MERRTPNQSRALTTFKAFELLTGKVEIPVQGYDGYTDGKSTDLSLFISEQMRLDWRANRAALLKVWRSGDPYDFFPWLPWLYIERSEPQPWCERVFGPGADGQL
jgi:hypothetical protein